MERIKIIGVDISVVNFNSAQKYLFDNFEEARGHYICAANVHTTVTAHENNNYREVQNNSFMTLPDGKPLSVVGKKRGKSSMGRVTGPDFLEEVLKRTENTEVKHYFYGTTQENLDSFISAVKKSYPNFPDLFYARLKNYKRCPISFLTDRSLLTPQFYRRRYVC